MTQIDTLKTETQDSISLWAEQTFGPASSLFSVATRLNEEIAELLRKVAIGAPSREVVEEVADVKIILCRLATRIGVRLDDSEGGRLGKLPQQAASANMTCAQLLIELAWGSDDTDPRRRASIGGTVQWLAMHMRDIAFTLDRDLDEEVNRKMAINRGRTWSLTPDHHGYHVPGSMIFEGQGLELATTAKGEE